jgi:hypothetical protein
MPNQNQPVDWDNLLFRSPTDAVDRIKREAVAEARKVVTQDYLLATNRERWERMFYGHWSQLAAHKEVVEMKMVEVCQQSPEMSLASGNIEIAKRSEAFIKHRQRFAAINRERSVYSGGPGFDGPVPPTPMSEGGTMGDTIKARREKRRAAYSNRALLGSN